MVTQCYSFDRILVAGFGVKERSKYPPRSHEGHEGKQGLVIARQWNYSFDRLLIALLRVLRGFVVNLYALCLSAPPQVRSDQRA
jgi:hypothetical protein